MLRTAQEFYNKLSTLINQVEVTGKDSNIDGFYHGIEKVCNLIIASSNSGGKLIFIGNGASASISSHMATDFWKTAGVRAVAFNDSSLLTCISNDYGYKFVFEKPVEMFADAGDILFAISSSGKSENILRGVDAAKKMGVTVVTLSGFDKNNPLRGLGEMNFYVPDMSYGHVEIVHHSICHCLVDVVAGLKDG